jgi:hypothetical protein
MGASVPRSTITGNEDDRCRRKASHSGSSTGGVAFCVESTQESKKVADLHIFERFEQACLFERQGDRCTAGERSPGARRSKAVHAPVFGVDDATYELSLFEIAHDFCRGGLTHAERLRDVELRTTGCVENRRKGAIVPRENAERRQRADGSVLGSVVDLWKQIREPL